MGRPLGHSADGALVAEVVAIVRGLVEDLAAGGATAPEVHGGSHLAADLGLDSLGVVELAVRVERRTGLAISDEQLVDLHTVADVAAVAEAGPPRPTGTTGATSAIRAHAVDEASGAGGAHVADGASATDGTSGTSGADGTSGTSGPDGTSGTSGTSGPDGVAAARRAAAERQVEAEVAAAAHAELPTRPSRLGGVYALFVFAVVATVAWPVLAVLPGIERRWRVVRAAGRVMLAGTGSQLEASGLERLPDRPYVVVANHTSFLDPLLVAMTFPPPMVFTAVRGLDANPLVGRFLAWMRCYLVMPGDRARARRAVADLTDVARSGWPVVVFPEGRRSERVGLEPFHLGAFRIAADAGVPVVPVAIRGARALLPVGRSLPARGPVQVVVGAPLAAASSDLVGVVDLQRRARAAILAELGEPDLA